jgi:hypothetical protein
MPSGTGKYSRVVNGVLLFGRVRIELAPVEGSELRVDCSPSVFAELGDGVDPNALGYVAWRRGAEHGVRAGAEISGLSSGVIEIRSIVGTTVDTTEGAVAGAAALALWDAAGFEVTLAARARLDEIVVSLPFPFDQ